MARLTTDWSAIITSSPLNKDAAIARDGHGESFEPAGMKLKPDFKRHDAPFKMKPYTGCGQDFTGQKIGRLTVIGCADMPSKDHGARWVVRCICGYYEIRRSGTLSKPDYAARAKCSVCDYTAEMLKGNTGGAFPKIDLTGKK
jgi:hypothetical protein